MDGLFSRLSAYAPQMLSVLRIMSGLLFMQHGTIKWLSFPTGSPMTGTGNLTSLGGVGGLIELIGGFLLAIGLFTRPVAFICAGEMAVAYFIAHHPRNFFPIINNGELAIMFCFVFLYFIFSGPGPWSVDAAMRRNRA